MEDKVLEKYRPMFKDMELRQSVQRLMSDDFTVSVMKRTSNKVKSWHYILDEVYRIDYKERI